MAHRLPAGEVLRPKLGVGSPDSPLEREADATADRVLRTPSGPACPSCGGFSDAPVVKRAMAPGAQPLAPAAEAQVQRLAQGGEPLPATVRARFEPGFGKDLSGVRVHRDAAAAEASQSIGARAFAVGNQIAFGAGQWAPGTAQGDHLIAHELAHVVQGAPGRSVIRRDSLRRAGDQPDAATAGAPTPLNRQWPTTGETVKFGPIELTENPDQLTDLMRSIIVNGTPLIGLGPGMETPLNFLARLRISASQAANRPCNTDDPDYEFCHRNEILRTKILPVLTGVAESVTKQAELDLKTFGDQAIANACQTLDENEHQAKAEGIRYGLTEKQVEKTVVERDEFGVALVSKQTEREHSNLWEFVPG